MCEKSKLEYAKTDLLYIYHKCGLGYTIENREIPEAVFWEKGVLHGDKYGCCLAGTASCLYYS